MCSLRIKPIRPVADGQFVLRGPVARVWLTCNDPNDRNEYDLKLDSKWSGTMEPGRVLVEDNTSVRSAEDLDMLNPFSAALLCMLIHKRVNPGRIFLLCQSVLVFSKCQQGRYERERLVRDKSKI